MYVCVVMVVLVVVGRVIIKYQNMVHSCVCEQLFPLYEAPPPNKKRDTKREEGGHA